MATLKWPSCSDKKKYCPSRQLDSMTSIHSACSTLESNSWGKRIVHRAEPECCSVIKPEFGNTLPELGFHWILWLLPRPGCHADWLQSLQSSCDISLHQSQASALQLAVCSKPS